MSATAKQLAFALFVSVIVPATALSQKQPTACPLENAVSGQITTLHGKTLDEPHDLGFAVNSCDGVVILTYAGDQDNNISVSELRRDRGLRDFKRFTRHGDEVEATLTGKLEIATIPPGTTRDPMGFLHDASGKVVGTSGFGHPSRMFKYRLVILSVTDVHKLPRPKAANPN